MEADLFTSFDAAPPAADERGAIESSRLRSRAAPAGSFFSRLPGVTWLLLAGAVLVIVTAMIYYWRRRHTTQTQEKSASQALGEALKQLQQEVDVLAQQQGSVAQQQVVLSQQHNTLASQLRSVAAHSRSVEQGLGQALESWTATIQQLREEFELLVEEEEEDEQGGQPAANQAADAGAEHAEELAVAGDEQEAGER